MRRGRTFSGLIALLAIIAAATVVPSAVADGGTPMDICQDLQDGKIDGTYTIQQLQAFFSDPTVQGYCGPITITVTPPPTGSTPPPTAPPTAPPVSTPPSTPVAPVTPTPAPTPVTGVKGAQATVVSAPAQPATGVRGATHTVRTPVTRSAAAPLAATKTQGTLPFTGAQLSVFLLVGLALVATGLMLRSTARPRQKP